MILETSFRAKVHDVEIFGINEFFKVSKNYDIQTEKSIAYVEYELQPEVREWGIKEIYICIKKVSISIEWEIDCWEIPEKEIQMLIEKTGGKEYGRGYNHTASGN